MGEVKKIGKYEIISTLGQGAMGVVYKAFDPNIERTVALKTIRKDVLTPKDLEPLLTRFKQEAQAAGRLTHPGIVTVYEYGEDEGTVFIAMEFVQGRELKEILDNHERLPLSTAVHLITQLLDALAYSHANGVVHRDIKPGNIFILQDGRIKVTDFGIAKIESSTLTQCGDVFGTPSCMSPEQFTGQPVDRRSDLFSVGVILYHLLAGEKPFPGNSLPTIMHRVLNTVPPTISEVNFQISANFDQLINTALAKNASERFQSATEFAAALKLAYQASADRAGEGDGAETMASYAAQDEATILQPNSSVAIAAVPGKPLVDPLAKPPKDTEKIGDSSRNDSPGPPLKNKPWGRRHPWLVILLVIVLSVGSYVVWLVYANNPIHKVLKPPFTERQQEHGEEPVVPIKEEAAPEPAKVKGPDKARASKRGVGGAAPVKKVPGAGESEPYSDWP